MSRSKKHITFEDMKNDLGETVIRFTATKCAVSGEYNRHGSGKDRLTFKKDKYGGFKVEWSGHIPVKTERTERCSLGHSHKVYEDENWVWDYTTLSVREAQALAEFLLGQR